MINIADLYCGAGGESTGIIQAMDELNFRYDLAAVNHWELAIETHKKNHPQARHFCADIDHLNPHDVFSSRKKLDFLWASPECTHHSIARGGKPRSNQSRASAWMILKWCSELYIKRLIIENVPEFLSWGPLGSDGRPLKSGKGKTFNSFIRALQDLGYKVDFQILCAANYGDPTTRRRLFIQAVRGGKQILWPEYTHTDNPDLFTSVPWVPARNIIDWNIPAESIFTRKRPLAPATLKRIELGIRKFWGEWAEPFLVILRGTSSVRSSNKPVPTITAGGGHIGLVEPFIFHQMTPGRPRNMDEPLPAITTKSGHALVEPFIYTITHGGRFRKITDPIPTITCAHRGEHGIVSPFLSKFHGGNPDRNYSINNPLGTIDCSNRFGLVNPFLIKYYGCSNVQNINNPLGTVTTKERFAVINGDLYKLDITFRMLQPHELAAAQGFPNDYIFAGNKTEQVKQIGNAVPVNTARALVLSAFEAA